jgi:CzcA family heavy metal efflux pump
LIVGALVYTKIQVSLFPQATFPKIKVIADNGEQPVDKMMITVTKPLENAIKQVQGLRLVRSATSRGSCEISAFFEWGIDIDLTQQMLESRINQVRNELPAATNIQVVKMNPSVLPVMGYSLESKTKSLIELKLIALNIIRPFLSQVTGVSNIRILGGKTKEYWVELKVQKMSALGITPQHVSDAMSKTNFILSNGYINDYRRLYLTLTDEAVHNLSDIENLVVRNDSKRIVFLKDIADVVIKEKVEYIKVNANGEEGVLVNVVKQPDANLGEISGNIHQKISELKKILPKDVKLVPYYDQNDFVSEAIKSVRDSLWIGLFLAIILTVIFLHSIRASTTILLTIPLTLALSLIVMYIVGYNLNIMTIGALAAAIGLIIDDAVVVVEQIHRTREEHPEESAKEVVHKSINYLLPSMVSSSLSTIVIFVPFILMSGVAGAYFSVLANTMIIVLACSFFVTWIGLPVLYLFLSSKDSSVHTKVVPVKKRTWISFFIERPVISILFVIVIAGCAWLASSYLQTGFFPEMDEGSIVLDYKSLPGTALDETDRLSHEMEKIIKTIPEVEHFSRRTGTEMGFFITEPNKGDYLIQLKENRKRSTDDVIEELRNRIKSSQPALHIEFGQVIEDMLGDLVSTPEPIEIKVYGDNPKKLQVYATQIGNMIDTIQGVADVFNGIITAGPSINVNPNSVTLAQYNLSPADLQFQLQTQTEGTIIGNVQEKEQLTDIRMVFPYMQNNSLEHLQSTSIFLPGGKLLPLEKFADSLRIDTGVAEIQRENSQSMLAITARLNNRDLGSTMNEIKKLIASNIQLPQGYHISYGGAYAEQKQSFRELMMILISACMLVFAVILFMFKDYKAALLILVISVLGICGSILALYITGTPLNVGSYTGIIMIVGIIGENAIFTFQQFKTNRENSTTDEAINYAISTRLRPKLMTATGAIIALMPLALGIGRGAILHQPLAIAVIGGFLLALPLLLIVLPTFLRIVYRKRELGIGNQEMAL